MKIIHTFLVVLLTCGYAAQAQTVPAFYVEIPGSTREQVFDQTLQLLIDSRYFIQSTDKSAGLIRCKTVVPDKRVFSAKNGDVLEFNLLIRQVSADTVRIQLQTNLSEKQRTGTVGNVGFHNNDLGVTYEEKYYKGILAFLRKGFLGW